MDLFWNDPIPQGSNWPRQKHVYVPRAYTSGKDWSNQALKYRSVTDIVQPIREIVRRREETTGHSVRPK
jgi:hypothetical protein